MEAEITGSELEPSYVPCENLEALGRLVTLGAILCGWWPWAHLSTSQHLSGMTSCALTRSRLGDTSQAIIVQEVGETSSDSP